MANHGKKPSLCAAALAMFVSSLFAAQPTTELLETVKKNVEEQKAVLVDVREKKEWDFGHLDRSLFLPLSELDSQLKASEVAERIPKDRIIYTFCVKGIRARTAADILRTQGYDVRPLKPGYEQLLEAGFPKADDTKP